jgi:general secretion pathway protein K
MIARASHPASAFDQGQRQVRGKRPPRSTIRQRGAAVLLALFVATLATLIVSGLFYRQFIVLRTIENQQLLAQSRQILRGALDWSRAVLREHRNAYDALTEPWAQPLAETRLDQLGETSPIASLASMAGGIEDAQSRFNLRNLIDNGQVVERQLTALRKLAVLLNLPEQTADLIAQRMVAAAPPAPPQPGAAPATVEGEARPIPLVFPDDIAGIAGIGADAAAQLAPFVVILDERTPVNANTASAEVIAAVIPGLTLSDARGLVDQRDRISYFNNLGDIRNRLGAKADQVADADVAVASRYFLVRGEVKLDRAVTRMEALVKRNAVGAQANAALLWEREL